MHAAECMRCNACDITGRMCAWGAPVLRLEAWVLRRLPILQPARAARALD